MDIIYDADNEEFYCNHPYDLGRVYGRTPQELRDKIAEILRVRREHREKSPGDTSLKF